jgi:hypothetical protein
MQRQKGLDFAKALFSIANYRYAWLFHANRLFQAILLVMAMKLASLTRSSAAHRSPMGPRVRSLVAGLAMDCNSLEWLAGLNSGRRQNKPVPTPGRGEGP